MLLLGTCLIKYLQKTCTIYSESTDQSGKLECKNKLIFNYILLKTTISGTNKDTRGTAYVVYDDIFDAKRACEHLSGYNLLGRYLIVLYYQPDKVAKKRELERQQREIEEIKAKMAFEPNVNQ